MAKFESPYLYIDFARLPPPQIIEELDFEDRLAFYKSDVLKKKPDLLRALELEQSPTNVILEAQAYGETLVRARINAALRAVLLPFSTGTDLDSLGALYNVIRMVRPPDPNASPPFPGEVESDERFRRRIQLKAEAFTTAGSEGAYIYHAMSADLRIWDATAKMTQPGVVTVALMASGNNPIPLPETVLKVRQHLNDPAIKPLTDEVVVIPVTKIDTPIVAELTLYPGPSGSVILAETNKALDRVRRRIALIGRDLRRSAVIAALQQEGVFDVDLVTPAADIIANDQTCVWITSATVTVNTLRSE